MRLRKIFIEYRTILVTLLTIIVVVVTGYLLYQRLSNVSNKISNSLKQDLPASFITRQIILDLRLAENNARSYQLTHDINYIQSFYNTSPEIENKITALKRKIITQKADKVLIDSFINLSRLRFELIKTQSYISDPARVTEELNIITKKIDETYPKNIEPKTDVVKQDSVKKKKSFIKRLFGSKSNDEKNKGETLDKTNNETIDLYKSKNKLKKEVQKVKQVQLQQLEEYKKNEYEYSRAVHVIRERMDSISDNIKRAEDLKTKTSSKFIEKEINDLKINAIVFSAIISLFLFMLAYLIVSYVRKKTQYELALLESKKRSDDLAKAKELFLANMSHEIKTPLNAIHGFTEQILTTDLKEEQKEQLNIVKKSAAYLSKLVSDILTYSKLQSGKSKIEFVKFDLKNEFDEIGALFKVQSQNKNIKFEIVYSEILEPVIATDLHKLKQILFNIIGNAIKFTNKGGVKVNVKQVIIKNKNILHITVLDTGIGIDDNKIDKLFNEFEQGDEKINQKYGGTGLGLFITKQIIEQLGGEIFVKSKIKVGTEVNVKIPFDIPDKNTHSSFVTPVSETNTESLDGKYILIVDDEEFNRLLIKSILKKHKLTIIEASNGEEAIQQAKLNNIDLIIMDIRMPLKNGIEATSEIRKFNQTVPIIASTAVASEEKIAKCIQAGMNSVVFKPFKEDEFLQTILNTITVNSDTIINQSNTNTTAHFKINFENINNYFGNDEQFKNEMILTFRNSLSSTLSEIESLMTEKKYSEMSEIAHKILPSCKYFDINELVAIFSFFEKYNSETEINESELQEKLTQLKKIVVLVNEQIDNYFRK